MFIIYCKIKTKEREKERKREREREKERKRDFINSMGYRLFLYSGRSQAS